MRRRAGVALAGAILSALLSAPAIAQRTVVVPPQDYPANVRPGAAELEARVRYTLGAGGAVTGCEVTRSSRQPAIDAESCRILRERGRFSGPPGAGELKFRWLGERASASGAAPGGPLAIDFVRLGSMSRAEVRAALAEDRRRGTAELVVEVSADGAPLSCAAEDVNGAAALARWWCGLIMSRAAFIPASDGAGGRGPGRYRPRLGGG